MISAKNIFTKQNIIEFTGIIIGSFIMALGTSSFLLPNQLSSGGFAGIGTITYYLWNLPVGIVMFALNIPLFILGYFRIGRDFFVKSLIGTVALTTFIDILDGFPALTQDRFLACIYGGIASGIGTAIVLKVNSSTGGTDLLSYVIKSYKSHFRSSTLITTIDIIIVFVNVLFFKEIEIGLYSAIAIYLMGKMIDIIFEGIYFTKIIFIVSDEYNKIAKQVGDFVKRGSTGIYARGMYTNEDKMLLMCIVSRKEIAKVKQIVRSLDKRAFMVTSNAREALGQGFKKE